MGLSNPQSNSKFVTIVAGKFTIRLQEGDTNPAAVERTLEKGPNAGKVVRELRFSHLDGFLKGGEIKHGEYGTDLVFNIEDDGETFKFQIPLESGFFGQVAKRLPNIDPSQKILFGLGHDKEKDKPFIFIKQNGNAVHMKFTKDHPNGLPEPQEKMDKGKKVWDWTDQENFLYDVSIDFLSSLDGISGQQVSPSAGYTDADAPAEPELPPADDGPVQF